MTLWQSSTGRLCCFFGSGTVDGPHVKIGLESLKTEGEVLPARRWLGLV